MNQTQLQAFVKSAVAHMENANPSWNPYQSIVSTGNSQLSFGAMQLDVGSRNPIAVNAFTQIMNGSVGVKGYGISDGWKQADINNLIHKAKTDASNLTRDQKSFIDAALAANTSIVDQADAQQLTKVMSYVNGALTAAAHNPNGPGEAHYGHDGWGAAGLSFVWAYIWFWSEIAGLVIKFLMRRKVCQTNLK